MYLEIWEKTTRVRAEKSEFHTQPDLNILLLYTIALETLSLSPLKLFALLYILCT